MPDDLNLAVDAQIDAYRPTAVPPFAVIEARKRGRDRLRLAVGAAALSVVSLAAVGVAVPSLGGGGERLTPGAGSPGALSSGDGPVRFGLSYDRPAEYDPERDQAAAEACLSLPGTSERSVDRSLPPGYSVLVTGAENVAAFQECAQALPGVVVRTVPDRSAQGPKSLFRVASDGTADPAAYTAGVEKCLALPDVTGSSVQESYPATYEIAAAGDAADALEGCLRAAPGAGFTAVSGPAHDRQVPSAAPPVLDAPVCPEGYECGESGPDTVPRCGPGVADEPCAAGLEEGQTYRYLLYTHCGVKGLYADGGEWVPEEGQDVGQNGAPAGFGDPEDSGSVRLISDRRLVYRSSSGVPLRFVPGQIPADDCN